MFGAEFEAMSYRTETVHVPCYNIRIMGVTLSRLSYIYGENMSVINNTQIPEFTLKKKSSYICDHAVQESGAMEESNTENIYPKENVYDLITKLTYDQE